MLFFRRQKNISFYYPGQEIKPAVKEKNRAPDEIEVSRNRIVLTACTFALAFSIITRRLFDVTMPMQPRDRTASKRATRPSSHRLGVSRADIVDRKGNVVATSLPTVNLYANPRHIMDAEKAASRLISVLPELDYGETLNRLKSRRQFVYLKRNLSPRQQYEVNRLGVVGLNFEKGELRIYPQGTLLSHVLGFAGIDNHGLSGVEKSFDEKLLSSETPLKLSIDTRVQDTTRIILNQSMESYKASGGVAIVSNIKTGEIVSIVSLPDFDPNNTNETLSDGSFNKASLGVYEMGSIFKIFNTALALESGKVKIDDSFNAIHPMQLARFTIRDFSPQKRWLNVVETMVYSSNIASAQMAMLAGASLQKEFMSNLGFLERVDIEIPERGTPLVPSPWREINTATISYGYGLAVTPLHVIAAANAILNDGKYIKPTLLARNESDVVVERTVISEETSKLMRDILRMVVINGSGKSADILGYKVGGKTGSAEKLNRHGSYVEKHLRTGFLAAFPMDNPTYSVLVMLDEPKPNAETHGFNTAGWNAAPTTGKLIAAIAPQLNLQPKLEPEKPVSQHFISAIMKKNH